MLSLLQWLPKDIGDGKAIEALTTENMRRFNEETPDLEGVQYFSWGAAYQPGLLDAQRFVILSFDSLFDHDSTTGGLIHSFLKTKVQTMGLFL